MTKCCLQHVVVGFFGRIARYKQHLTPDFPHRDGATHSGLACVMNILMSRLDHDRRLTVPLVVGQVKAVRPQVVTSQVNIESMC